MFIKHSKHATKTITETMLVIWLIRSSIWSYLSYSCTLTDNDSAIHGNDSDDDDDDDDDDGGDDDDDDVDDGDDDDDDGDDDDDDDDDDNDDDDDDDVDDDHDANHLASVWDWCDSKSFGASWGTMASACTGAPCPKWRQLFPLELKIYCTTVLQMKILQT